MLVLGFIFICLWVCCTVDKTDVVLSFADVCSSLVGFKISIILFVGIVCILENWVRCVERILSWASFIFGIVFRKWLPFLY